MLEEATSVPGRDRIERPAQRFHQSFASARLDPPEQRLHFGKEASSMGLKSGDE
jgi:hypothetical protein